MRAGGADAMKADPEKIPQVILRADVNAPWRCVAGTIWTVQNAGYPIVGFISNPKPVNGGR
jgi:biopolymer transport protein ExbD